MSENRGRRNRRYHNRNRNRRPRIKRASPDCGVCGKPIRDVLSAIYHSEKETPAHFDCVMREIHSQEKLQNGERVSYLGSGVFAIIRATSGQEKGPFVIRKKIQYEDKEKAAVWRKSLSITAG